MHAGRASGPAGEQGAGAAEDQFLDPRRVALDEGLGDHAAVGLSQDERLVDVFGVEDGRDAVGDVVDVPQGRVGGDEHAVGGLEGLDVGEGGLSDAQSAVQEEEGVWGGAGGDVFPRDAVRGEVVGRMGGAEVEDGVLRNWGHGVIRRDLRSWGGGCARCSPELPSRSLYRLSRWASQRNPTPR